MLTSGSPGPDVLNATHLQSGEKPPSVILNCPCTTGNGFRSPKSGSAQSSCFAFVPTSARVYIK